MRNIFLNILILQVCIIIQHSTAFADTKNLTKNNETETLDQTGDVLESLKKYIGPENEAYKALEDEYKCLSLIPQGRAEQAVLYCKRYVQRSPESAIAHNNLGWALFNMNEYDKAIKSYSRSIEINPRYRKAIVNRSNAYLQKKEYEKASKDLGKIITLFGEDSITLNNKGWVEQNLKRYKSAIDSYSRAIKLDPNYATAIINRARLLVKMNQLGPALLDYERLAQLAPNNKDLLTEYRKVRTMEQLSRQPGLAADDVDKLEKSGPKLKELINTAIEHAKKNELDKVELVIKDLSKKFPKLFWKFPQSQYREQYNSIIKKSPVNNNHSSGKNNNFDTRSKNDRVLCYLEELQHQNRRFYIRYT